MRINIIIIIIALFITSINAQKCLIAGVGTEHNNVKDTILGIGGIGQSNEVTRLGTNMSLTLPTYNNVQIHRALSTTEPMVYGVNTGGRLNDDPENYSFSTIIAGMLDNRLVLKNAKGAEPLAVDSGLDFNISSNELSREYLDAYDIVQAESLAKNAIFILEDIIWVAGETDANFLSYSQAYYQNGIDLINTYNSHFGYNPRWHILQLRPDLQKDAVMLSNVRTAQSDIAALFSFAYLWDMQDVGLGDPVHYNAQGIIDKSQQIHDFIIQQ